MKKSFITLILISVALVSFAQIRGGQRNGQRNGGQPSSQSTNVKLPKAFFFDAQNGVCKIYELNRHGKLASKVYERDGLNRSWDIVFGYEAKWKHFAFFYDNESGTIKICEIGSDGHFGPTNYQRPGFIHFDLINIYKWGEKHYMCCYEGDTRSMQTFRLEDHGEIGMMEPAENELRTTWKAVYVY